MSLFTADNKQAGSSWMKFTKVGDGIEGTILEMWIEPSKMWKGQAMPVQQAFLLELADGTTMNVGVRDTAVNREKLRGVQKGEKIGFRFDDVIDTGKPEKAKVINIYRSKST
jgi:hypothetical protein